MPDAALQPIPQPINTGFLNPLRKESIPPIRTFDTGANRDTVEDKKQYAGFLSPLVIQRFGAYMHKNRKLADGSLRAADNWQKGIPQDVYEDSLFRHFMDFWALHRGFPGEQTQDIEEALCGMLFNCMGYLHEQRKKALSDVPTVE